VELMIQLALRSAVTAISDADVAAEADTLRPAVDSSIVDKANILLGLLFCLTFKIVARYVN
jgi:hypothetical protein